MASTFGAPSTNGKPVAKRKTITPFTNPRTTNNNPVPASSNIQSGVVGVAYSDTITVQGGLSPYTFAVTAGTLPAGLSLTLGVISGTPETLGTSTFTIQVTDSVGATGSQQFSITINNPASGTASGNYGWAY